MTTMHDPFSVSVINRARDRIVSSLVKAMVSAAGSTEKTRDLVSDFSRHRITRGLEQIYGFDHSQVQALLQEPGGQQAVWNLVRSISEYGIRAPQTLKAPVSVVWSLSYGCNLRCMHCYQNASRPSSDELTLDQQLNIVDQMAQAGVSMVVLSGGEPLTNPNLSKLVEKIREHDMAMSIDSNGVLMDGKTAEFLTRSGVGSVELSLDSVDPACHDSFRGLEGAFKKTVNAIDICSEAGIFTTVATTATTLNYTQSNELISLAKSHGADRVVFFDLIPAGRGREIEELRLSRRQLLDLMSLVKQESSTNSIEVFTELPQFIVYSSIGNGYSESSHAEKALSIERFTVSTFFDCTGQDSIYRKFATYLGGCPAGRLYCNIQPNGDVTPCMFMPEYPVAGNLKNQSFEEIWNSPTFQSLRDRTRLKGKCRECKFAIVCGGCRAKAAAYERDYLASDPTCPIQNAN